MLLASSLQLLPRIRRCTCYWDSMASVKASRASLTQNDTSVTHKRGQIGCLANARGALPFKGIWGGLERYITECSCLQ